MGHLELNDEYQLVTNGFVVFKDEDKKWILKKISIKNSSDSIDQMIFESYDKAKNFALGFINHKNHYIAIVRYDRGLGIEYKNFDNIIAKSNDEAYENAFKLMLKHVDDKNMIKEIKVKNKI